MINFKVGDKVVKTNGEKWTNGDEYREIIWVSEDGTHCQFKTTLNVCPTSRLKLYKTDHKNYIEVLTNIKIGEVWSSLDNDNIITKTKEDVVEVTNGGFSTDVELDMGVQYTLTKTLVSFHEAFLAYEEGKEIESEVNNETFIRDSNEGSSSIRPRQIRGKWFIND